MDNNLLYDLAFDRPLAWLDDSEKKKIREIRVGFFGIGEVAKIYIEILARLGVSHFILTDPDFFYEESNTHINLKLLNRYNQNKAEALCQFVRAFNPQAEVRILSEFNSDTHISNFINEFDIFIDGLEFYDLDFKREILNRVVAANKIAITTAPVGTGASTIVFSKKSMSFDQYFGYDEQMDFSEKALRYLLGLMPSVESLRQILESRQINLSQQNCLSFPKGVYSAATGSTIELLKTVLERDRIPQAPWSIHYDPKSVSFKKTYLIWGSKNPIHWIKLQILKIFFKKHFYSDTPGK